MMPNAMADRQTRSMHQSGIELAAELTAMIEA
jgi:hypothetical protein